MAALAETLRVVFIGPPGAGKGTQAANLKKEHDVCHLATGDMLRDAIRAGTSVGKAAKDIMDKGGLVPDEVMVTMIADAIKQPDCARGFILDGFPRTVTQARKLDGMLHEQRADLDQVFEFAIDDQLLVRRITGRRVHPASGRTYHLEFFPPKLDGKDDVTGEPLVQRADDTEATLRKRLDAFHQHTAPVIAYYQQQQLLTTLDASGQGSAVFQTIQQMLRKARSSSSAPLPSSSS